VHHQKDRPYPQSLKKCCPLGAELHFADCYDKIRRTHKTDYAPEQFTVVVPKHRLEKRALFNIFRHLQHGTRRHQVAHNFQSQIKSSGNVKRTAAIQSLFATAKRNQLNPAAWLTDVIEKLLPFCRL
jgi:hypothetical protein